jgi:hypothetical protein
MDQKSSNSTKAFAPLRWHGCAVQAAAGMLVPGLVPHTHHWQTFIKEQLALIRKMYYHVE